MENSSMHSSTNEEQLKLEHEETESEVSTDGRPPGITNCTAVCESTINNFMKMRFT